MRANPDFTLRAIGDVSMLVSLKGTEFRREQTITINESGALLWRILEAGGTKKDLADMLQNTYGIDESTALPDVEFFLDALRRADALIDS